MASAFAKGSAKPAARERRKVAQYVSDVHEHVFTDKAGNATGQTGYAFRIMPVDAEGATAGMTLWVWLDDHTALGALIESMPSLYTDARKAYQIGVDGEGWPKLAKPEPAKATAPKAAPAAEPAKPKSSFAPKSEAAAAKAAAIDDGLEEMPF